MSKSHPNGEFATPVEVSVGIPSMRLRLRTQKQHTQRYWEDIDREAYVCPMCDDPEKRAFEVHHINHDWLDGRLLNLVALCHDCHVRVHSLDSIRQSLDDLENEFEALVRG